jgi:multidrug efflux pump subunit AcrB
MNVSYPFIRRPIGTALLAIGLFLLGAVAYKFLPVASLPNIEFPTIRIGANRPGADPVTMAASVAAPLERRLAEIASVTEITSVSSLGSTSITVQFDLNRSIDRAARDVQAAINAAASDLPTDLPTVPYFRKSNPAAAPILILALTSNTIAPSAIYDIADSVIAQRIAQVEGVAEVTVNGAEQPAVRVRVDPIAIASMGLGMDDVRAAIVKSNAAGPIGMFDGQRQLQTIATNNQLFKPADYDPVIVRTASGSVVRLSAIASIESGVRNTLSAAWFNGQPSVLLIITKQAGANVIETVDHIHRVLHELKGWVPADLQISALSDRTRTIRASVRDMQLTLCGTILLVMLVVFLFLRRGAPTIAAGITVPLSLAGTCALMWVAGYSIDNLSLMALAVSVGFVVDDAIVMIENVFRNLEAGRSPLRATLEGARQIGFTVVSISVSLIAAFIPLLFMGGIVGRLFGEFSVTLVFAIAISTIVSLSITPMICAHFVRAPPSANSTRLDRVADAVLNSLIRMYGRTLGTVLRHRMLTLLVMVLTITLTISLYVKVPKGYFPQDDTGLLIGATQASSDISFKAMSELQQRAAAIVGADPAVASVGSSIGTSTFNPSINQGRLFISLKPLSERKLSTPRIVDRLRGELAVVTGLQVFLVQAQDLRVGARSSKSQYQFTLWSSDIEELTRWTPKIMAQVRKIPGLIDVSSDREQGGLQATLVIDRLAAARLCVNVQDIDNALGNAFAQAQISTIYGARNQYRVILEIDRQFQRDPSSLNDIFVRASGSAAGNSGCADAIALAQAVNAATGVISGISPNEVPLSAVARFEKTLAPLVVNHQGQFPSVTITYNLALNIGLEEANARIQQAVTDLHLPGTIHSEVAGDVKAFAQTVGAQPLLLVAALIAVYIVLGVLYESLAHPITIISTLPSAGLGALLALQIFGAELTVIAFIGIILLIGIVKKNGIMMVDFALEAERRRGLSPERAIFEACLERFRPILMTTMAALLGAVPLALAIGPGSELRRPLGITIIGGLLVSQVLTLYTTPVIYLLLDRLHHRLWPRALAADAEGRGRGGRDRPHS